MIGPAFISTSSISNDVRQSISRLQGKIVDAQKELTSGRHADGGKTLGAAAGKVVSLRHEALQYQTVLDSNAIVRTRLNATQLGLQAISDTTQSITAALVRAHSNSASPETIVQEARSGLNALIDTLNTSLDGQYIFSGINSDVRPLQNYFSQTPPASRQAVADAFLAKFGISQSDPAVALISAADMQDFVDNAYPAEFSDANWAGSWSEASDKAVRNRISRTELLETSVTANSDAFRALASALALVSDSGFENLNATTKQVVIDKALQLVGTAVQGITTVQSQIGVTQERVSASSEQIELQRSLLDLAIEGFEGVDPAEVSVRLSSLMTQMETAYALTSRIYRLSLLDFI